MLLSQVMAVLSIVMMSLNASAFFGMISKIYAFKTSRHLAYLTVALSMTVATVCQIVVNNVYFTALIIAGILFIDSLLFFKIPQHRAIISIILSSAFTYAVMVTIGVVYSVMSLIFQKSLGDLFATQPYTVHATLIITSISCTSAFFIIQKTKKITSGLKNLLTHFDVTMNAGVSIVLLLFVTTICVNGQMLLPYNINFAIVFMMMFATTVAIVIILLNLAVRVVNQLDYETQNERMQIQLNLQMMHYKSYADYTRGIRRFQEKYKDMMAMVQDHLINKEYDKIKPEIDEINELMYRDIIVHKEYSNHPLVDAIMQSVSNECKMNQIIFNAKVYAPKGMSLNDGELCQLFLNISQHLLKVEEVCANDMGKYLTFESNIRDGWILIIGSVPCSKEPPETQYKDEYEDIVDKIDGVVYEDKYDTDKNEYQVILGIKKS